LALVLRRRFVLASHLRAFIFVDWIMPLSVTNIAPGVFTRPVHALADIYLTHFPFVALAVLWLLQGTQIQPTLLGFATYATAAAFAATVWWVLSGVPSNFKEPCSG
jgi:hypothetical protein